MTPPPNLTDASAFVVKHRTKILAGLAFLGKVVEHVAPEKIARIPCPKRLTPTPKRRRKI